MQLRNLNQRDSQTYIAKRVKGKKVVMKWWRTFNLGDVILLSAMFALFICAIWAWVLLGQETTDPTPVPDAAVEEP